MKLLGDLREMTEVIGAFSEEQVAQLAGVSRRQLRSWDRIGLLRPSYGVEAPHVPFGRVYSFRDLVSARVVGQLRNKHRVSLPHLLQTLEKLSTLSDDPWSSTVLYVLGREVVVMEPGSRRKLNIVSGQRVLDIPLKLVIGGVREDIAKLGERGSDKIGQVAREKFVAQNQLVLAGTRIPVAAIKSFADGGFTVPQILQEYPGLTAADVEAAIARTDVAAA